MDIRGFSGKVSSVSRVLTTPFRKDNGYYRDLKVVRYPEVRGNTKDPELVKFWGVCHG